MNETMLGWHWLAEDRKLRHGNHEVVEVGKTYTAVGPLQMCVNGVHASRRALDALEYAPGPVICRVKLVGEIQHDGDKSVARCRTVLKMADATSCLHEFALLCAEDALGGNSAQGREPDARSWAALEVKRRWLRGEASNEELDAARAAAGAAASSAAVAAAWNAASSVARAAAGAAASSAAVAAAWNAASSAAGAAAGAAAWAAWVAARAAARAARDAAGAAAGDAARDTQNFALEEMLTMTLAKKNGIGGEP